MVAEIREALERTGTLYTRDVSDPGHISGFWRNKITAFCDYVETLPLDAAERLEAEKHIHNEARNALSFVEKRYRALQERAKQLETELAGKAEHDAFVRQLVVEAVPRMRSLNNQMSPGRLARAEQFLGE